MFRSHYQESISSTCALLGLSRQVYYRAIKSHHKRQVVSQKVVDLVHSIRIEQPRIGTRKLYHILKDSLQELGVGRDYLFRILKANKMLIKPKRSYHITTNSHHRFRKHKNLIENVIVKRPEQIWVSDITYVGTRSNPMYLSLITDAYSKKIVGYHVDKTLEVKSSLKALERAIKNRKYPSEELIHHSDRGLQYCSDAYQELLTKNNITCSMTESYDPYQNAIAERVNGILKQEFLLDTQKVNLKIMKKIVEQSINIYNNKRPHLSCDMITPNQMHKQRSINIKTYKKENSEQTIICPEF